MKPLIFISSVSRELRTARQLVANTLHALGYEPVWQDIFETSPDDLREMLRKKIDSCSAVLQIVGHAYGAEPPTPDATFGRCSYTQYEALYARSRKNPVYYLIAENDLPRDAAAETIDSPVGRTSSSVPPGLGSPGYENETDAAQADATERQRLQAAYRQGVLTAEQVYYPVHNHQETELSVRRLRDDLSKLRRGFRAWMIGISAVLVLIAGGVGWNQWSQHLQRIEQERQAALAAETKRLLEIEALQAKLQHEQTQAQIAAAAKKAEEDAQKAAADLTAIKAKQAEQEKITAAKVRAQLIESSEASRDAELAVADKEPAYDKREEMREAAKAAHTARLSRIDVLADEYARIEQQSDTTEEFREMVRILTEEKVNPVEKALAFAEKHRAERFERVRARKLAEQQQSRADLQIDLKAASTEAASGQSAAARKLFEELLTLEPNWPEALEPYAWFLVDQSFQSSTHGTLMEALVDAEHCLELSERLLSLDPNHAGSQRAVSAACNQMGDILNTRGQPGDAEKVLALYTRSLELNEQRMSANPGTAQADHDVSASLNNLGNFLSHRGQAGDADQALAHYGRSLILAEQLLSTNPNSVQAARDVSVSLINLGDFLSSRGQPGDADQALAHYERSLKIYEQQLSASPDSAQAARDVSVSLERLGYFLSSRRQAGDAERALTQYERSLKVREQLLSANPDSALAARDLSVSLIKLGDFLSRRGLSEDADQALAHYERSLILAEQLLSANSDSAEAALDLSVSLDRLGDFLSRRAQPGDLERALTQYERSLNVRELVLAANPDSAEKQQGYLVSTFKLFHVCLHSKDRAKAIEFLTRGIEIGERELSKNAQSFTPYNLACFRSLKVLHHSLVSPDPNDIQIKERKLLEAEAIGALRTLIDGGFGNFNSIRQDADFKVLHGLPDFEALFPKSETK